MIVPLILAAVFVTGYVCKRVAKRPARKLVRTKFLFCMPYNGSFRVGLCEACS
jgi:hypothetical protein